MCAPSWLALALASVLRGQRRSSSLDGNQPSLSAHEASCWCAASAACCSGVRRCRRRSVTSAQRGCGWCGRQTVPVVVASREWLQPSGRPLTGRSARARQCLAPALNDAEPSLRSATRISVTDRARWGRLDERLRGGPMAIVRDERVRVPGWIGAAEHAAGARHQVAWWEMLVPVSRCPGVPVSRGRTYRDSTTRDALVRAGPQGDTPGMWPGWRSRSPPRNVVTRCR